MLKPTHTNILYPNTLPYFQTLPLRPASCHECRVHGLGDLTAVGLFHQNFGGNRTLQGVGARIANHGDVEHRLSENRPGTD